jgi:hypothetical protein
MATEEEATACSPCVVMKAKKQGDQAAASMLYILHTSDSQASSSPYSHSLEERVHHCAGAPPAVPPVTTGVGCTAGGGDVTVTDTEVGGGDKYLAVNSCGGKNKSNLLRAQYVIPRAPATMAPLNPVRDQFMNVNPRRGGPPGGGGGGVRKPNMPFVWGLAGLGVSPLPRAHSMSLPPPLQTLPRHCAQHMSTK